MNTLNTSPANRLLALRMALMALMVAAALSAMPRAHAAPAPIDADLLALPLAGAGTVTRVDTASGQIEVAGKTLRWHPERVRVLDDATGKPATLALVVSGRQVRFALEPRPAVQGAPARILLIRLAPVL